jgi:hypothetical protein
MKAVTSYAALVLAAMLNSMSEDFHHLGKGLLGTLLILI